MSMYVAEGSESIFYGLCKMNNAIIEEYTKFLPRNDDIRKKMGYFDGFLRGYQDE